MRSFAIFTHGDCHISIDPRLPPVKDWRDLVETQLLQPFTSHDKHYYPAVIDDARVWGRKQSREEFNEQRRIKYAAERERQLALRKEMLAEHEAAKKKAKLDKKILAEAARQKAMVQKAKEFAEKIIARQAASLARKEERRKVRREATVARIVERRQIALENLEAQKQRWHENRRAKMGAKIRHNDYTRYESSYTGYKKLFALYSATRYTCSDSTLKAMEARIAEIKQEATDIRIVNGRVYSTESKVGMSAAVAKRNS